MSRSHRVLLVMIGLLSVAGVAADKKSPAVIKGWGQVIDPDNDCIIKAEGQKRTVKLSETDSAPRFDFRN